MIRCRFTINNASRQCHFRLPMCPFPVFRCKECVTLNSHEPFIGEHLHEVYRRGKIHLVVENDDEDKLYVEDENDSPEPERLFNPCYCVKYFTKETIPIAIISFRLE